MTVRTYWAWETTATMHLLGGVRGTGASTGEGVGAGGTLCHHVHSLLRISDQIDPLASWHRMTSASPASTPFCISTLAPIQNLLQPHIIVELETTSALLHTGKSVPIHTITLYYSGGCSSPSVHEHLCYWLISNYAYWASVFTCRLRISADALM